MDTVVRCAGAVVLDASGRLLLVRRGRGPARGQWCEPSGRRLPEESARRACVRETEEETGLRVRAGRRLGNVAVAGPDGARYDIAVFRATVLSGSLRAGDDAAEARWVGRAELAGLDLVAGLRDWLTQWECLPR